MSQAHTFPTAIWELTIWELTLHLRFVSWNLETLAQPMHHRRKELHAIIWSLQANKKTFSEEKMNQEATSNMGMAVMRDIVGVIVGYLSIAAIAVVGVLIAWQLFGVEGAFEGKTTTASSTWSIVNCSFGLIAAVIGGIVAALISYHKNGTVLALAALVLVFGAISAIVIMNTDPVALPDGMQISDLSVVEAGAVARSPDWYNFTIPVIGVIGVFSGGCIIGPKSIPIKND